MTQTFGWARVWPAIKSVKAPTLRRGAWYQIVDATRSTVQLSIGQQKVTVPRRILEIRVKRPDKFTVVHRRDQIRARQASHDRRLSYVVCPSSLSRLPVYGHPDEMQCPNCGHKGPVAWWESA